MGSQMPNQPSMSSMGSQNPNQPSMSSSTFQQQSHQPWLSGPNKSMQSLSSVYQSQLQQQALHKQQQQQWQLVQSQPQQKQQAQQLSAQQLPPMQQRAQLVGAQRPTTTSGIQQPGATGASNIPADPADDLNETVRQKQAHFQTITNPIQGLQSMGMMASGGSSSQLVRPSAPGISQQQRIQQASQRPQQQQQQQSITSPQKMQLPQQGPRASSTGPLGSIGSQTPNMSSSSQSFINMGSFQQQSHQQWVPGQPKSMQLSSAAYQSQFHQQVQQKQQQHQVQAAQQTQQQRQQPQPGMQLQQQAKQQPQSQSMQQQLNQMQNRAQLVGNQRPPAPTGVQQNTATVPANSAPIGGLANQASPSSTRILGKRSIQELVAQVDPHQTLDPEVEDILVEIADNFIESVTASACALAKHRKSSTLEVKDVLLHLDRNWHITIPGFGGDEYRSYKKPSVSEAHKQRIQLVKKSLAAAPPSNEGENAKTLIGSPSNGPKYPLSAAALLISPLNSPGPSRTSR